MALAQTDSDKKLKNIKENIEDASQYFYENAKNFNRFKEFVYKSSITKDEKNVLRQIDKPVLEFNVCEAYVSRLKGEFSKQEPSVSVRALSDEVSPLTVDVVEGHIRYILKEANNDKLESRCYDDTLSGGYSVMKIWTEYEHENSFNQVIKLGKVFDPTLTGFDPLARKSHKGDGHYCYELFPLTVEEFKEYYPDIKIDHINFSRSLTNSFNWYYINNNKKVLLIANYYEKRKKKVHLHYLSNGQVLSTDQYKKLIDNWNSIEQPPTKIKSRWTEYVTIDRYEIIGDTILFHEETDFKLLPLIFVDGNSAMLKDSDSGMSRQFTRPYFYHAMDAQRLKNFAGQTFANEIENMVSAKFMVEERSIPEKYIQFWQNPQKISTLVYRSQSKDGIELPPPRDVPRSPIPGEVYAAFDGAEKTIQSILGSYDASLGINNNQLSGVAIVEGATQSNAAAMPYIVNFMAAMNQVAEVFLDLIPKYYVTPRSIPVVDGEGKRTYIEINKPVPNMQTVLMKYDSSLLEVSVEAAVNFKVQQQRSLNTMGELGKVFQNFAAFMNQKGLPTILDNVDIRGIDDLKDAAKEWLQEQEQAQQAAQQASQQGNAQQNPEMMIQSKDLMLRQQKQQMEHQIQMDRLNLEAAKLQNEKLKLMIQAQAGVADNRVQYTKAETEKQAKAAELAMKEIELAAKHGHFNLNGENHG